jgi:hypothetical protein
LTGLPPGHMHVSPVKSLRIAAVVKLESGLFGLTTTATSVLGLTITAEFCPVSGITCRLTTTTRVRTMAAAFRIIIRRQRNFSLYSVQVRLQPAVRLIELELECHIRVEIIAGTKAWAIPQAHVMQALRGFVFRY